MKLKQILKNEKISMLLKYSSIKYIALIIVFLKGIISARVLGPELLGVLGNLLLVLTYISYSSLGILYSMNREYVIYESRDDQKRAKEVISTSFTSLLILSVLLILVGIGCKFVYRDPLGTYILLVFIIGVLEQFRMFYINYFRLINKFRKINYIELINNVLAFVLIVIFIKSFKIYSVLFAMAVADFIVFFFGYFSSKRIHLKINPEIFKNLIIVGIPLLIYNLGFYILTTVDRVVIIKFLGYTDLGYFTFSNQIVNGTLVFITSVLFLYYPKAIKTLNIENNYKKADIVKKTLNYTKFIEAFGVVLCLVGAILIEPFVLIVVPKYLVSINIYRILVFGVVATQIAYFANVFIVSNKKQMYLVYLQGATVILAVAFNLIFIKLGFGIIGVCLATLITNVVYSIIQYIIYMWILDIDKGYIKNVLKIYLKFVIYTIISIAIGLFNLNIAYYSLLMIILTGVLYYRDIKFSIKSILSSSGL
ncbi:oligosaccharide flippase family protein [Clostridium algoriphilum]|uniref:lipopolysaccharide biosynthesis protein n=1 Tax=Clostridium algoriphilum TaxID=198347 RepID=UPI001CF215ED|nr:oligosaccharide flippase family protein [Clostridium algoriphilum]MCB2293972.1 oligosaccharide flippase family protein [Clostridium algoriphilum]